MRTLKTSNKNWHPVTYNEYGVARPIQNTRKNYTLLFNAELKFQPYCVAYAYDSETNTWGQGHYFHDLDEALQFLAA